MNRKIIAAPDKLDRPFVLFFIVLQNYSEFNLMRFLSFPGEMHQPAARVNRRCEISLYNAFVQKAQSV